MHVAEKKEKKKVDMFPNPSGDEMIKQRFSRWNRRGTMDETWNDERHNGLKKQNIALTWIVVGFIRIGVSSSVAADDETTFSYDGGSSCHGTSGQKN